MISVIVPVFKVESILNICINSILNQTFNDIELILIDDGSPDKSGDICDQWAKKDSRVVVVHSDNQGQCAARNKGLDIAKGNKFMFVDSDDFINSDLINKLNYIMDHNDCDLVRCGYTRFSDYGKDVPTDNLDTDDVIFFNCEEIFQNFVCGQYSNRKAFPPIVCAALYKKNLFDGIRFPEGKIYEEGFVLPHIFLKCQKSAFLNQCLYYYYENTDGTMSKDLTQQGLLSLDDWKEIHYLIFDIFPNLRSATIKRWIDKYIRVYLLLKNNSKIDIDGSYKNYIKQSLKENQSYFKQYAETKDYKKIRAFNRSDKFFERYLELEKIKRIIINIITNKS